MRVAGIALLAVALLLPAGSAAQTDSGESSGTNNTGLYAGLSVLVAGGLYLLFRPHHKAPGPGQGQNPPPPPNPPAATPTPVSVTPSDHTTESCDYHATAGWYEPTQAVWQDDQNFDDKPGKQISLDTNLAFPALHAELAMAVERHTVIFGVNRIAGGSEPKSRTMIQIRGVTNCTTAATVKVRFNLNQHGASSTVYETAALPDKVDLDPPKGAEHEFVLKIPTTTGLPPEGDATYKPFTFVPGFYSLEALVVRAADNAPTTLRTVVFGNAHNSPGPTVHFVRATFSKKLDLPSMANRAKDDAALAKETIPDFYPVPPFGFRAVAGPAFRMDANALVNGVGNYFTTTKEQNLASAVADQVGAQAFLTGAGRVVVAMSQEDFDQFEHNGAAGFTARSELKFNSVTLSNKVIAISSPADPWSVAHEIAHTIPPPLWSSDQMEAECTAPGDYHNKGLKLANGVQLYTKSVLGKRTVHAGLMSFMGTNKSMGTDTYIDQCTYRNLIDHFENPPDPPMLLVRGYTFRGHGYLGKFNAGYDLPGSADLRAGARGRWALVTRNAAGMVLAHYGFEPLWTTPDGNLTRDLVSFAYRIPYSPDLRLVELQSPRGVVAAEHVAASPPQVHVTNAVRRGGTLWVSWRSTPGTLASVLLSSDGQIWDSYRFETPNRSTTLTGIPRGPLHVKVIVTNGSRSGSAVVMTP